ncbi:MAG: PIN domain-containing protein [Bacteroidales bacterium]|jgi:predicted nucleic acid-binding protein|nr:PIN domain-containing protein [Bacteroidales bacterium]MDD4384253.1 PIN domain-containing protein [Bacteroidales bacterium]MDY0197417.1 PIN domain-containing protein [Tenuifilaceae bacterium]
MKRALIDTNIIIDLLAKREPFDQEARKLFSFADKKKVSLFTSALSIANVNYVLLRKIKPEKAKQILRKLKLLVGILSLDEKVISLALNDNEFKDFEDGLQYYSALENNIEIILTRNLKDFENSKIPVMTAGQFNKIVE